MKFTKMHGCGNDFILIDSRSEKLNEINLKQLAIDLCDRHFGIGADGLLILWPSTKAHYKMQILNPDGSEAEMCGNGIRCLAKYVYEKDQLKEEVISVETPAGIRLPAVILSPSGKVEGVEVDMGKAEIINNLQLTTDQGTFEAQIISMGNPHAVIFTDDLSKINLLELGPQIENDPHFPSRTNVEFVKVLNDKELEVIVWERGAGETMACGTGACACVVASGKKRALVHLPGGNLDIEINEAGQVLMRGPAKKVFEGELKQ
ncbi:diaminopimelate epimerase [Candidatus Saganbacteria bacterium CG08_land_8_20_14_0_20_45_16]|uniref:Diaminopimelate epimerase n=1 Tax=Candidatus Saganbacteria bacterium CG08_land_8_20_14_0_20_45_16 TaxID=2014293 RepID=A0A2H0Y1X2_UNCSA|nr:MAG: diaminopimelate epimerase [Candidatus Saganbacteria bacterium CG08_land_8_20_14_0_20_45_16]